MQPILHPIDNGKYAYGIIDDQICQTRPFDFSYEDNPEAYEMVLKGLKEVHETRTITHIEGYPRPFRDILELENELKCDWLPNQLHRLVMSVTYIYASMGPWLQKNMQACHGDFTKANVATSEKAILMKNWSRAYPGDALFDFVKFTIHEKKETRLKLLEVYLGRKPTTFDINHFWLLDLVFKAVVVSVRYRIASNAPNLRSKEELEKLVDGPELPSFLSLDYQEDPQLGATAALQAFLQTKLNLSKDIQTENIFE